MSGVCYRTPEPISGPCADGSCAVAELIDEFDDGQRGSEWQVIAPAGTVSEVGNELVLRSTPGQSIGQFSTARYRFRDSVLAFQLGAIPSSSVGIIAVVDPTAGRTGAGFVNNLLIPIIGNQSPASLGLSPLNPFWRIRENAGQIIYESSPDGQSWQAHIQSQTPGDYSQVQIEISLQSSGGSEEEFHVARLGP